VLTIFYTPNIWCWQFFYTPAAWLITSFFVLTLVNIHILMTIHRVCTKAVGPTDFLLTDRLITPVQFPKLGHRNSNCWNTSYVFQTESQWDGTMSAVAFAL